MKTFLCMIVVMALSTLFQTRAAVNKPNGRDFEETIQVLRSKKQKGIERLSKINELIINQIQENWELQDLFHRLEECSILLGDIRSVTLVRVRREKEEVRRLLEGYDSPDFVLENPIDDPERLAELRECALRSLQQCLQKENEATKQMQHHSGKFNELIGSMKAYGLEGLNGLIKEKIVLNDEVEQYDLDINESEWAQGRGVFHHGAGAIEED